MNTAENVRYHAAGHLSAAAMLIGTGHIDAARVILQVMSQYVHHDKVDCPPAIYDLIADAIADPASFKQEIVMLESWFVDPLNTTIEKSGNGFGGRGALNG